MFGADDSVNRRMNVETKQTEMEKTTENKLALCRTRADARNLNINRAIVHVLILFSDISIKAIPHELDYKWMFVKIVHQYL